MKIGVGDSVKVTVNGETVEGIVLDYEKYPGKTERILLIHLANGQEKEMPEKEVKRGKK